MVRGASFFGSLLSAFFLGLMTLDLVIDFGPDELASLWFKEVMGSIVVTAVLPICMGAMALSIICGFVSSKYKDWRFGVILFAFLLMAPYFEFIVKPAEFTASTVPYTDSRFATARNTIKQGHLVLFSGCAAGIVLLTCFSPPSSTKSSVNKNQ